MNYNYLDNITDLIDFDENTYQLLFKMIINDPDYINLEELNIYVQNFLPNFNHTKDSKVKKTKNKRYRKKYHFINERPFTRSQKCLISENKR